jgi:hypothetical protein
VDFVEGTGEVVGDGAKAVGKGAGKLVDDVTGIFKSDKPTNEPPVEKPVQ